MIGFRTRHGRRTCDSPQGLGCCGLFLAECMPPVWAAQLRGNTARWQATTAIMAGAGGCSCAERVRRAAAAGVSVTNCSTACVCVSVCVSNAVQELPGALACVPGGMARLRTLTRVGKFDAISVKADTPVACGPDAIVLVPSQPMQPSQRMEGTSRAGCACNDVP